AAHLPARAAGGVHRTHRPGPVGADVGGDHRRVPVVRAGGDLLLARRRRPGRGPRGVCWSGSRRAARTRRRRRCAVIGRRPSAPKEDGGELSMLKRLDVLLGDRRRTVVALALSSLVSGFAEAGTLALIAEVGAAFVGHAKKVHIHIAGVHLTFGIVTLLAIALGLALIRLAMQVPISILPSRIASEVQRACARSCSTPTRAPPGRCSRSTA